MVTEFLIWLNDAVRFHGAKVSEISRQTGISQHYLYKIMNGSKHTSCRDYIILISLASGFSVGETNKALMLNGMNSLNSENKRDRLIIKAIEDSETIVQLNYALYGSGMPTLKNSEREDLK